MSERNQLSPHFFGAYKKGRLAYLAEGDKAVCPYLETRGGKYRHVVTFSRAYQKFWHEGFQDEKSKINWRYDRAERKEKHEHQSYTL